MSTKYITESSFEQCQNGIQRFLKLKQLHEDANYADTVEYAHDLILELEIPTNPAAIALTKQTNFNGCTIKVKNVTDEFYLFSLNKSVTSVQVTKAFIDDCTGATVPQELSTGHKMLIIEDQTIWSTRIGYSEDFKREDILILKDGKHQNKTIAPYSTTASNPICAYTDIDAAPKTFENLHFVRDGESTRRTYLLVVNNQHQVHINNISVKTVFGEGVPEDGYDDDVSGSFLTKGDNIFRINDSANIHFSDIFISGTYCSDMTSGYGIGMRNVYHCVIKRLFATAKWGIFGNVNINEAYLYNCDINRFDIHCYGANISFYNCTFRNTVSIRNNYNQFSSIFGKVTYDNCHFHRFLPVLFDDSYNAYTGFELTIKNGTFVVGYRHYLVSSNKLDNVVNNREELASKCMPNVYVNGLTIIVPSDINTFSVIAFNNEPTYQGLIGYMSKLIFKNVTFLKENPNGTLSLFDSNYSITLANTLTKDVPAIMNDVNIHSQL